MRIQHNIMAMSAYRNYTNNVSAMKKNLEKLSSGYKINRAGDDAAGLAISEKMRAQITGLQTAQKNAKDGISLVQTAEGALTEVHDMLNRMVELATMSANGTYDVDTDRTQLQKELNQLTEEIDRIAQSSNFNGIKLLDGSLGMNTEAIQVGKITAATDGATAANASDLITLGKAADGSAAFHGVAGDTEQQPKFSVNLGDLKITAGSKGSIAGNKIKVTIGGKDFTIASGSKITAKGSWNATTIASKLAAAINKSYVASGTLGWNVGSSGMIVKASAKAGVITFTYQGVATAGKKGVQGTKAEKFTVDQAKKFNEIFGGTITVDTSGVGSDGKVTGTYDHNFHDVYDAVSGTSERTGVDLTINKDLIKDGNTLKIGETTFEFKVSKNHNVTSGNTSIDVSGLGEDATDEARLREAIELLSRQQVNVKGGANGSKTYTFDINSKDADGGKIHLEQTVANYASGANSVDPAKIANSQVISAKKAATEAANAKVEVTVDVSKFNKGDIFSIGEDGKDKFEFGNDFNSLDELESLIAGAGYTVEKDGNKLTISAKTADDAAPTILGKGLTLQVGDTAEDFNQLKVTVKDCHAKSLGIDKEQINILDEDSAQKAIEKIKKAINYVSDVRGTLGATQNRLDHTINNLSVMTENIQDAESTIRDVDVAEEMMAYTKNNILIQSAQAMLAQANQVPQGVLQLLQ